VVKQRKSKKSKKTKRRKSVSPQTKVALPLYRRLIDASLIRFLLVGVFNTFLGLFIIWFAKWFWRLDDAIANAIGYAIGINVSFMLNKRWTFRHTGSSGIALIKFFLVTGVAYLANLATVLALIHIAKVDGYFAQALGIAPYTTVVYLGGRFFAFSPGVTKK